MMILMKQRNILHLHLLSRVQMGPQQRLKQNFIKKNLFPWKSSNFDEIFPARKQKTKSVIQKFDLMSALQEGEG